MFCPDCGNPLTEDGVCAACAAKSEPDVVEVEVETPALPVEDPGKKQGVISMILGIASLVLGIPCSCMFACLGGFLPLIASVVSIVLGSSAMKKSKEAGFAKNTPALVGLILSIASIVIILVFIVINAIIGGAGALANMNSGYYY